MGNILLITIICLYTMRLTDITFKTIYKKRDIIYNKILKNKPDINRSYAKKLANIIDIKSIKYNIDPIQYTAMLAQESQYRLEAVNTTTGDYGISQINYRTAAAYGLDIARLISDLEYSVEAGLIVLFDFKKRYAYKETDYWSRYNSSNRTKRDTYKKSVEGYI